MTDSQVLNSLTMTVLGLGDGYAGPAVALTCNNCLFSGYYGLLTVDGGSYDESDYYNLTNCTLNNISCLEYGPLRSNYAYGSAVNCIFANSGFYWGYSVWQGGHNGFYNAGTPFGSPATSATSNPFTTSGSDAFYLASDYPFRNIGTTGIGSALLADIENGTTYTLASGGWPDNDGQPDLGYHYPLQDGWGGYPGGPGGGGSSNTNSVEASFWTMFYNLYYATNLSLYISSPVAATGKVTLPGVWANGPVLIVTNCGDAALNGTYALTQMTAQEQADWASSGLGTLTSGYQNGTSWAGADGGWSSLCVYDAAAHQFTDYYDKRGENLGGASSDWTPTANEHYSPAPTTICPQAPLAIPFTVTAGGVTNIAIPLAAMETNFDKMGTNGMDTNGIYVAASQPVSVYGMDYTAWASAAFTSYPVSLLGTNYCLMARAAADPYDDRSQFAIVATETNTTVWITPSATADLVNNHTNVYSIVLTNQGQTYEINSSNGTGDVTGTRVTSDQPIGVFAGANIAWVPNGSTEAGNPLVQEQMPVEEWGTNIVAMSFAGRTNGDTYRVLACSNATVTITGTMVTILSEPQDGPWTVRTTNETLTVTNQAGQFYDIIVDGPVWFQADQPIQVAHFANGAWSDNPGPTGPFKGDPCETLLTPVGHWLQTNIVVTLTNDTDQVIGDFYENHLNLIVPQSATNSTWVDNSLLAVTNFVPIGASGYYGAQITITNSGIHTVISSQPVGVEVYGWGQWDAYSYFGGIVK